MSFLHEPGDLARTPLAAILLEALNLRASGVLAVEHGGGTSRVWLRDGRPVAVQVVAGIRPLGQILLQAGLIDIDALSRSLAAMAESGRPQGELLVEMGAVSQADVDRALAEQQAGYFGLIADLPGGSYHFDLAAPMPAWTKGPLLSPLRTIVDSLERPQAGALVVSALQPVANGGIRLASGYAEVEPAFRWTAPERTLVSRLLAPVTLDAFFSGGEIGPERARAILATLLLLGLALPASERATPSGDTLAGLEIGLEPAEEPPAAAAPVPATAPPPPPAPGPAPAPGKRSDPAEARARRQRLLQQAMRNMGIGPFAGPAHGAPPHGPPATPGPGAPAKPAANAADELLRKALLEAAPRAREKDFFLRLGVPETASRDDVKRAFLALAKQFHPDRFASPGLKDLADAVKDFFSAVNEAYETLSDDKRRAEYLGRRKTGGAAPGQAESARVDFQKAEACLRTRDLARARGLYEAAVRADPRPEYQAALAQVCLLDAERRDRARAKALLDEALKDPACDRAAYVAGLLARDDGDDATAERLFRAAFQANPRNVEAVRELRAIELRRTKKR